MTAVVIALLSPVLNFSTITGQTGSIENVIQHQVKQHALTGTHRFHLQYSRQTKAELRMGENETDRCLDTNRKMQSSFEGHSKLHIFLEVTIVMS